MKIQVVHKVFDKTLQKYPRNSNRNNAIYTHISYAKRGLDAFKSTKPGHEFEIHTFYLVPEEYYKEMKSGLAACWRALTTHLGPDAVKAVIQADKELTGGEENE